MTEYLRGSTGVIERVFIQDTRLGTGGGLTGLTASSAGLIAGYMAQGDTAVTAFTLSAGTLGTWSSGGFAEVDSTKMPGVYEYGVPNAAVAKTGAFVDFFFTGAANAAQRPARIDLVAYNPQDAVRQGLTALPDVAAGGAGGLPLGDAAGNATLSATMQTAIANTYLDLANAIETGLTPRQAQRIQVAFAAGVLAGAAGTTVTVAAAGNPSTPRIAATVDASGNRTAVTLTP